MKGGHGQTEYLSNSDCGDAFDHACISCTTITDIIYITITHVSKQHYLYTHT